MLILLFIFLFIIVPLTANSYLLSVANIIGITIIAALGLNILTGYTGQINIGQAAFVAVGSYLTAGICTHLGWSWWAALVPAIAGTALIGAIFGLPSLRVKGFYLAMSTLAAHFIIIWVIIHASNITGGAEGMAVPPIIMGGITIDTEREFYFLVMGFTVLMVFIAKNLTRMKLGRALVAIRDNDLAAEMMGIDIFRYKLLAFLICSVYAGVAGALLAPYLHWLSPEHFPLTESIWYLGYIIVGGMGSITGTIFGVIFLKLLSQGVMILGPIITEAFPTLTGAVVFSMMQVVFGVVIIIFLVFEPRGLYHRWEIAKSSFRIWPFPY
jgi:branched-chain amino acid transport system permease protein